MMIKAKLVVSVLLSSVVLACHSDKTVAPPGETPSNVTTFDDGTLAGWQPRGTDLIVGGKPINWSIEPTTEKSHDGAGSAHYYVENFTDAAKVWLERGYTVQPNRDYDVVIEFAFGTYDNGDVNLWRIIAGAASSSPTTAQDLAPAFRDDTGNGGVAGLAWLNKHYVIRAHASSSGKLYVVVGVWGTWETARTYYVDDLKVSVQ
jgi:hypothetical protein